MCERRISGVYLVTLSVDQVSQPGVGGSKNKTAFTEAHIVQISQTQESFQSTAMPP